MSDLFPKFTAELVEFIPLINHIFIAIRSLSDDSIAQIKSGMMAAAVMAQKKGANPIKMIEDLIKIFQLFPDTNYRGNFLEQVFVYIVTVADVDNSDIKKAIACIPDNIKDNIMNTYTRIKEEGKLEGELKGKLEGKLEEKTSVVLNANDNGLEIGMISNITQLTEDEIMTILMENNRV